MKDAIVQFFIETVGREWCVFLCSMLPIIELRGSIIIGCGMGMPWWQNYIISVVGNLIPVPFILFFIPLVLEWMKKISAFRKVALWVEEKANKNSAKVMKYATFGLLLFVAIPLPGTGAWTGALVASLFGMKKSYSMISIAAGVLLAGVIVSGAAYGVFGFLKFIL